MLNKSIIFCENDHFSPVQMIAESLIISNLSKSGNFKNLLLEFSASIVYEFKQSFLNSTYYAKDYSFMDFYNQQISNIERNKIHNMSEHKENANKIIFTSYLESHSNNLNIEGYDEDFSNFDGVVNDFCSHLENSSALSYFGLNIINYLNFHFIDMHNMLKARDAEIVDSISLALLNREQSFVQTGQRHCLDFHKFAKENNILDKYYFVNLKSNLPNVDSFNYDITPEEIHKYLIADITLRCGANTTSQIIDNLNNFNLTNLVFSKLYQSDNHSTCPASANNFMMDKENVLQCDINYLDKNSYDICLKSVVSQFEN